MRRLECDPKYINFEYIYAITNMQAAISKKAISIKLINSKPRVSLQLQLDLDTS